MKIILTSTGLENEVTLKKIKNIVNDDFKNIKMLVIPVARKYEYSQKKYLNDYLKLGFIKKNIIFFDDEKPELYRDLDIDLIYVCGGNTFLLKKCLVDSNFEEYIIKYVKKRSNIYGCKRWYTYSYC